MRQALKLHCDGMEIDWVRRVNVREDTSDELRRIREETRCALTAHAPYFINLNSQDETKLAASIRRILQTARAGARCGCTSFTFHAAFLMKMNREEVNRVVVERLKEIQKMIESEKLGIMMRPELTGKESSWGSLEELLELSRETPAVQPCVDWSHLHARSAGRFNTREEFRAILRDYASALGDQALLNMHMHISGIAYTQKGEKHHLNLRESDMDYRDLLRVLKEFDVRGVLVSESPNLEGDALLLKRAYRQV